jgi:hypothetical protein
MPAALFIGNDSHIGTGDRHLRIGSKLPAGSHVGTRAEKDKEHGDVYSVLALGPDCNRFVRHLNLELLDSTQE